MNKIQIKAEILSTISALLNSSVPNSSLLTDLKKIDDKHAVAQILIKELTGANEHKSLLICWLLTELIDLEMLNNELWDVIKSPKFNDHIKMVAFNMLKDLGNKIDNEVISGYFEKFNELINQETKEFLDTAMMNPEAQIDFMDYLISLSDDDKIILIKSLEDDYESEALANILVPVFLCYWNTKVGETALQILGRTKSQCAFHALNTSLNYADDNAKIKINKALSELKLSGIRINSAPDFYKEMLQESEPYKSFISFPDGHGNVAIIFSRIRNNDTLQFIAAVTNPRYGILDAFGFNSMSKDDFEKIVDKFYNYQERYEVDAGIVKYLLNQAVENSYTLGEQIPHEYICWENLLLDIEPLDITLDIEKRELSQKDIDILSLSNHVQNWFFDEITNPNFKDFIDNLSKELKKHKFKIDFDKYIADNYDKVYTAEELAYQIVKFNLASYLRNLAGDKYLAEIFYSLGTNYAFLTNVLRKSIYEYYVGQKYILTNQRKATNLFEKKLQTKSDDFELLQLDMIISSIETKWVENA